MTKSNRAAASAAELVAAWVSSEGQPHAQRPEDTLLAEHQLMRAVLSAMEKEAEDLLAGRPLRPEFWADVVDFIGNFVHRVHRVQEERFFFPKLIELDLLDATDQEHLEQDHTLLKQLTLALCDGVNEGDWEKALRVVSRYLHIMESHLDAEEQRLKSPALRSLSDEQVKGLQREFHSFARAASSETSRRHTLELTRSLCSQTGRVPAFDAE